MEIRIVQNAYFIHKVQKSLLLHFYGLFLQYNVQGTAAATNLVYYAMPWSKLCPKQFLHIITHYFGPS